MEASPVFVGIDVLKARLDVASARSDAAWIPSQTSQQCAGLGAPHHGSRLSNLPAQLLPASVHSE